MIIREGKEADIANIVVLLKKSLGENLMPKSEGFWYWKHVRNPFGQSPVLLALEGDRIIGVRAFLQWKWCQGEREYRAVRAVDTATDPDFQGKGIFSKLTLQLLEDCKTKGIDFVFNTPNLSSKPGYLKMGWKSAGKLPVRISYRPGFFSTSESMQFSLAEALQSPAAEALVNRMNNQNQQVRTHYSLNYLRWRYLDNPNIPYNCVHDFDKSGSFWFIYRIKSNRWGSELRVTDFFSTKTYDRNLLRKRLFSKAKEHRANLITSAAGDQLPVGSLLLRVGPECTVRDLNFINVESILNTNNWKPSLGALEVF